MAVMVLSELLTLHWDYIETDGQNVGRLGMPYLEKVSPSGVLHLTHADSYLALSKI